MCCITCRQGVGTRNIRQWTLKLWSHCTLSESDESGLLLIIWVRARSKPKGGHTDESESGLGHVPNSI
jgi:hypothetical protein